MKSIIENVKTILLGICFILIAGVCVSAQQTPSSDKTEKTARPQASVTVQVKERKAVTDEQKKFYEATDLTKAAFSRGEKENAKALAEALLKQAETMRDDWNYGNAVHVANLVLGHLALASGDVKEAKRFLLEAGKTPGSPQLNNFGPNMRLAQELLEKKETAAVLEYFELCAKFWKPEFSKLEVWKFNVEKGEMPQFGANLLYQLGK
jgi:hypothetical protein